MPYFMIFLICKWGILARKKEGELVWDVELNGLLMR